MRVGVMIFNFFEMKSKFLKDFEPFLLDKAILRNLSGGADLHCKCSGGSTGCWYYPGSTWGGAYPSGTQVNQDINKYCSSGQGSCSFTNSCSGGQA